MSRTIAPTAQHIPLVCTFTAFGREVFAEHYPQAPLKVFDSWLTPCGCREFHVGRWLITVGKA